MMPEVPVEQQQDAALEDAERSREHQGVPLCGGHYPAQRTAGERDELQAWHAMDPVWQAAVADKGPG